MTITNFDIVQESTNDLYKEARQVDIHLIKNSATQLTIVWTLPLTMAVYNGIIVTLSNKPFNISNRPTDTVRYQASNDINAPADMLNNAFVVGAFYDDKTTTSLTITVPAPVDPANPPIYYAVAHAVSNVLQYYPDGVHSYPIEASQREQAISTFTGDIPRNDVAPTDPYTGQVWFNSTTNIVMMWTGSTWQQSSTGNVPTGRTYTANPIVGDYFYDLNVHKLFIWNGTEWKQANVENEGMPMYNKPFVGTDGSYDERLRIINVLKGQLGWPAVCVELTEDHFNIGIDNALDEIRHRAGNAFKKQYYFLEVQPGQPVYYLNDPRVGTNTIVDILKIHRVSSLGGLTTSGDNGAYAQVFLNQYFGPQQVDLVSVHLMASLQEQFDLIFAADLSWQWSESRRELFINRKIYRKEKVLVEAWVERTEQELLVDRDLKQWLQAWAEAEVMLILGQIRSKYGSLPGAGGGISLNGSDLLQRGDAIQVECLRQIVDMEVGNMPPEFQNSILMG